MCLCLGGVFGAVGGMEGREALCVVQFIERDEDDSQ